ncbi:hypothetical protein RFI_10429 [Reticulomyxa filosa]|uniref:Uncharacterized protein n=1 Tax=Reticulomyxa filosa TaxID=46433 RepID=X6NLU1_RETFI|nr:hypothetical protein RFI_10429 [Reticulomyxa filosa]|eukprot:ETO26704.1 hypothetical protein RFI_10429 [Reticulomyxa filosa]
MYMDDAVQTAVIMYACVLDVVVTGMAIVYKENRQLWMPMAGKVHNWEALLTFMNMIPNPCGKFTPVKIVGNGYVPVMKLRDLLRCPKATLEIFSHGIPPYRQHYSFLFVTRKNKDQLFVVYDKCNTLGCSLIHQSVYYEEQNKSFLQFQKVYFFFFFSYLFHNIIHHHIHTYHNCNYPYYFKKKKKSCNKCIQASSRNLKYLTSCVEWKLASEEELAQSTETGHNPFETNNNNNNEKDDKQNNTYDRWKLFQHVSGSKVTQFKSTQDSPSLKKGNESTYTDADLDKIVLVKLNLTDIYNHPPSVDEKGACSLESAIRFYCTNSLRTALPQTPQKIDDGKKKMQKQDNNKTDGTKYL